MGMHTGYALIMLLADTIKSDVAYTEVPPNVIWLNAFGTVGAILVAAMGLLSSMMNAKKIQEVHVLVNSQFAAYKAAVAEILALEKEKSRAQGEEAGKKSQQ